MCTGHTKGEFSRDVIVVSFLLLDSLFYDAFSVIASMIG
jgi:hypothetical protein